MDNPIRVAGIAVEVQLIFTADHLALLLPHFAKVGITQAHLDNMINAHIASGETVTYDRWILEYGQAVLNPLMNKHLSRPIDHPTFNKMLLFALKDILDSHPLLSHFRKSKDLPASKPPVTPGPDN